MPSMPSADADCTASRCWKRRGGLAGRPPVSSVVDVLRPEIWLLVIGDVAAHDPHPRSPPVVPRLTPVTDDACDRLTWGDAEVGRHLVSDSTTELQRLGVPGARELIMRPKNRLVDEILHGPGQATAADGHVSCDLVLQGRHRQPVLSEETIQVPLAPETNVSGRSRITGLRHSYMMPAPRHSSGPHESSRAMPCLISDHKRQAQPLRTQAVNSSASPSGLAACVRGAIPL